jgi:hypothetical protein
MRKTIAAALLCSGLATLAPGQAAAQAAYSWSGPTLQSAGNAINGCRLRTPVATHSGSLALSNIFLTVRNEGQAAVRITANVDLVGPNSRKSSSISSPLLAPGSQAAIQVMTPGGTTRDGTTLRVTFTSCAAG